MRRPANNGAGIRAWPNPLLQRHQAVIGWHERRGTTPPPAVSLSQRKWRRIPRPSSLIKYSATPVPARHRSAAVTHPPPGLLCQPGLARLPREPSRTFARMLSRRNFPPGRVAANQARPVNPSGGFPMPTSPRPAQLLNLSQSEARRVPYEEPCRLDPGFGLAGPIGSAARRWPK